MKGVTLWRKKMKKNLTMPKKLSIPFSTSILSQNSKKNEGENFFDEKVSQRRKNPLALPGIIYYAVKRKNFFGSVR